MKSSRERGRNGFKVDKKNRLAEVRSVFGRIGKRVDGDRAEALGALSTRKGRRSGTGPM